MQSARTLCFLMLALLAWTGCWRRSTPSAPSSPCPTVASIVIESPPDCLVILGPPPAPPIAIRDLPRCRNPDGTAMQPNDPCFSTAQANALGQWSADVYLWSARAYRMCSAMERAGDQ